LGGLADAETYQGAHAVGKEKKKFEKSAGGGGGEVGGELDAQRALDDCRRGADVKTGLWISRLQKSLKQ